MIKVIELSRGAKLLVNKRVIRLSERKVQEVFGVVRSPVELQERIYDLVGDC